jgi:hypothetical protein
MTHEHIVQVHRIVANEARGDHLDACLFLFEACCFHSACAGRPSLTGVDAPMSHVGRASPIDARGL